MSLKTNTSRLGRGGSITATEGDAFGTLIRRSAAAYSLDRINPYYGGSAIRARRSSDNVETDIGFTAAGLLDQTALLLFCNTPKQPLDVATGSAAAYATRLVRTAYTGPCMRVRRSSDNAEADIGFTPTGELDTVALLAFTGVNSGFVTVWYDQSGNARNAAQATAANQPRIVNAGTVHTLNGRATVDQVATNVRLNIPAFSGMTSAIVSAVYAQATTNNGSSAWQLAGSTPVEHMPFTDGHAYIQAFSATRILFTGWSAPANELLVASAVQTGTALAAYRNGTQIGTTVTTAFTLPTVRTIFGGLLGTAYLSELIILSAWDGGSTNRQTLERSQSAYYGITYASPISAFVTTVYSQIPGAGNLIHPTAVNQPSIVTAGVVNLLPGTTHPAARGTGTQWLYNDTALAAGLTGTTLNIVGAIAALSPYRFLGGVANVEMGVNGNATGLYLGQSGVASTGGTALAINTPYVLSGNITTPVTPAPNWLNGTQSPASLSVNLSTGRSVTALGSRGSNALSQSTIINGWWAEQVISSAILSTADRQLLERSQGVRFGITVA